MDVVKVGGSILWHAQEAMSVLMAHDVLVVPGGGVFADAVRRVQRKTGIDDAAAHKMAILAMDQYGIFLSDVSGIPTYDFLGDVRTPGIILPSATLKASDPFTPSWDVTSDSIACHIAKLVSAEQFIILTDVDGIFIDDVLVEKVSAIKLQNLSETCVDRALPGYLIKYGMDCQVVNGRDKDALERALGGEAVGTVVMGRFTK